MGSQRELDLMIAAGDCSVQHFERDIGPIYGDGDGMTALTGYTMKRDTPDVKLVDHS